MDLYVEEFAYAMDHALYKYVYILCYVSASPQALEVPLAQQYVNHA